jgi:very-short-patch-repair endonuclease
MIKKHPIQRNMFYDASPAIHEKAKELRASMTPSEKILWGRLRQLREKGFIFRRQHPMLKFIADFYCHQAHLVVEVDGGIHEDTDRAAYDVGRTAEMSAYGVQVIRFTNEQVQQNVDEVICIIEKYLEVNINN